jgi:hypothetical protein
MRSPPVLQEDISSSSSPSPLPSAPPSPNDDDEEAILQAARHRYEASVLVRNHLETHAVNNPGASSDYVTWIATLHPENADITIDQRFFIPGNPWWTIYEDTKNDQIPTATAVPVPAEQEAVRDQQQQKDEENYPGASSDSNSSTTTTSHQPSPPKTMSFWKTCSPLSILVGIFIILPALFAVLYCEMTALLLCYFPSALFFHTARAISPPNCCTGIFFAIFVLLYYILSFCDSIILFISVFVTELVALMAYFVGFCTGGAIWAHYLHQQIRRLCHGIRIIFRKKLSTKNPPGQFFFMNCYETKTATTTSSSENDVENTNEQCNNDNYSGSGGDGRDDNGIGNNNTNNAVMDPIVSVAVCHDYIINDHQQRQDEGK